MTAITPRKRPVQARSKATVEAILEASARVLVAGGYAELTTTRVAAAAGVGIGTLYQYFPSKEALVVALLERSMGDLERAIAAAMSALEEPALDDTIEAMIDGLLAAKRARPELKAALRRQLPKVEGEALVRTTMRKLQSLVRGALDAHAEELPGVDRELAAAVLTTAVEGAVSSALDFAPRLLKSREFRDALVDLVRGYLKEAMKKAKKRAR
ncbi:TetR/AcrR family transcriptional regulator [Sandaracinus amylolyticus]|uniref:Transcriptional regulator, TetR family protein n=1 Tax=Sandaracinus amylolyticus TaxID=927083 RepID=A0A0F6W015_9BACT|nr:TetR/AcrR family transcriptional regulator [Sandaracinus amylolyticus]AKF03790.1 Transcriptional regulator, TetR family protein [Sandaracinus amylolyticus]